MSKRNHAPCVTKGCGKDAQHWSGVCKDCRKSNGYKPKARHGNIAEKGRGKDEEGL